MATLADSVHIIALTKARQLVLIRMYKQGVDEVMIQFPAGRIEAKHASPEDAAVAELLEETGIQVQSSDFEYLGKLAIMSTKATESAHFYLVTDVTFNAAQQLDENEEIEVLVVEPGEFERMVEAGDIWDALCIAGWELAKKKLS